MAAVSAGAGTAGAVPGDASHDGLTEVAVVPDAGDGAVSEAWGAGDNKGSPADANGHATPAQRQGTALGKLWGTLAAATESDAIL